MDIAPFGIEILKWGIGRFDEGVNVRETRKRERASGAYAERELVKLAPRLTRLKWYNNVLARGQRELSWGDWSFSSPSLCHLSPTLNFQSLFRPNPYPLSLSLLSYPFPLSTFYVSLKEQNNCDRY